jgi:hypothetical protein
MGTETPNGNSGDLTLAGAAVGGVRIEQMTGQLARLMDERRVLDESSRQDAPVRYRVSLAPPPAAAPYRASGLVR